MEPGNYYQLMAQYNQWMNRKLYAVCADISDAERKRDRQAFFDSIHGTLNHLLYGDIAWMGRFTGKTIPKTMNAELYSDFDALRFARESLDQEILNWVEQLSDDWLYSPFTFTSNVDGKTRTRPAWSLVIHMFNHQTHHRGQLTTLLTQMGYDYGSTDIPWLPAFADNNNSHS